MSGETMFFLISFLQVKLGRLPEVERAFVHLDYETDHSPYSEHKQVWNIQQMFTDITGSCEAGVLRQLWKI